MDNKGPEISITKKYGKLSQPDRYITRPAFEFNIKVDQLFLMSLGTEVKSGGFMELEDKQFDPYYGDIAPAVGSYRLGTDSLSSFITCPKPLDQICHRSNCCEKNHSPANCISTALKSLLSDTEIDFNLRVHCTHSVQNNGTAVLGHLFSTDIAHRENVNGVFTSKLLDALRQCDLYNAKKHANTDENGNQHYKTNPFHVDKPMFDAPEKIRSVPDHECSTGGFTRHTAEHHHILERTATIQCVCAFGEPCSCKKTWIPFQHSRLFTETRQNKDVKRTVSYSSSHTPTNDYHQTNITRRINDQSETSIDVNIDTKGLVCMAKPNHNSPVELQCGFAYSNVWATLLNVIYDSALVRLQNSPGVQVVKFDGQVLVSFFEWEPQQQQPVEQRESLSKEFGPYLSKRDGTYVGPLTKEAAQRNGFTGIFSLPVVNLLSNAPDKLYFGKSSTYPYRAMMETMFWYDYSWNDSDGHLAKWYQDMESLSLTPPSLVDGKGACHRYTVLNGALAYINYRMINIKKNIEDALKCAAVKTRPGYMIWESFDDMIELAYCDAALVAYGGDNFGSLENRQAGAYSRVINDWIDIGYDMSSGDLGNTLPTMLRGDFSQANLRTVYTCFVSNMRFIFQRIPMTSGGIAVLLTGLWELFNMRHPVIQLAKAGRKLDLSGWVPPSNVSSIEDCFTSKCCKCSQCQAPVHETLQVKGEDRLITVSKLLKEAYKSSTEVGEITRSFVDALYPHLIYGDVANTDHVIDQCAAIMYDCINKDNDVVGKAYWILLLDLWGFQAIGYYACLASLTITQSRMYGDERTANKYDERAWL